eukprot:5149320-Amphidinium_carterae.1
MREARHEVTNPQLHAEKDARLSSRTQERKASRMILKSGTITLYKAKQPERATPPEGSSKLRIY